LRRKIILSLIFLFILIFSILNLTKGKEKSNLNFKTAIVKRGDIISLVRETGFVEPKRLIEVKSKISGEIKKIFVNEGDIVKKGDILAELDKTDILTEIEETKAELKKARAILEKLKNTPRPQEIKKANATVSAALAKLKNAEADFKRIKKLYEKGFASQDELDEAQKNYSLAKAEYQKAKEEYELIKEGPQKEEILEAMAEVERIKAKLKKLKVRLSYTTIKSPIDGVVLEKDVEEGEMVTAGTLSTSYGTLLFVLGDLREMFVKVKINEVDIDKVKIGQKVIIHLDAAPYKKYIGKVIQITPLGRDENGIIKFNVIVKIKNPDNNIKSGMTADVDIIVDQRKNVLYVPIEAIRWDEKENSFVVEQILNGKSIIKKVHVGIYNENFREISGDIKEGDIVKIFFTRRIKKENKIRKFHKLHGMF